MSSLRVTNEFNFDREQPGMTDIQQSERQPDTQALTVVEDGANESPKERWDFQVPSEITRLKHFRIIRLIGRGGMGQVYEAEEIALGRRVALKILPGPSTFDPVMVQRFRNEAKAAAMLNHPNIVPVFNIGEECGVNYFVMQLIHGKSLAAVMKDIVDDIASHAKQNHSETDPKNRSKTHSVHPQHPPSAEVGNRNKQHRVRLRSEDYLHISSGRRSTSSSRFVFRAVAEIGVEIAMAIEYAHQHGVIHRDIKPSNIMIDDDGKAWVTDFGLAMVQDHPNGTQTGAILGTLRYMSPEQASGRKFLVDHRTDIYSLGVTLYELVALRKAIDSDDAKEILRKVSFEEPRHLRHLIPSIPEELEIIITKAIEKNPRERYQTAGELADDLRRFLKDEPILAKRPSTWKLLKRWTGHHQSLVIVSMIAFFFATVVSLLATGAMYTSFAAEKKERQKAVDLLKQSEGMRLAANAILQSEQNPGLAMTLASEASQLSDDPIVSSAIHTALQHNHECKTLNYRDVVEHLVGISDDGKIGAVGTLLGDQDAKRRVILFDTKTGKELAQCVCRGEAQHIQFQPNSYRLLVYYKVTSASSTAAPEKSDFYSVSLLQPLEDVEPIHFPGLMEYCIRGNLFSKDGRVLVLPSDQDSVNVYAVNTGERMSRFRGHTAPVTHVAVDARGTRAAALAKDRKLVIFQMTTAATLKTVQIDANIGDIRQIEFASDPDFLVVAGVKGGCTYQISGTSEQPVARWPEECFAVHPQLRRLVAFKRASTSLITRDLLTGQAITVVYLPDYPNQIAYSSDGKTIVTSMNKQICLVDELTGVTIANLKGHTDSITRFAIDNQLRRIVSAGHDKTIRVWDSRSFYQRHSFDRV